MSLACYCTHKKPVCDKCDAGMGCTKFCPCGCPKKASAVQETPHHTNPEHCATTSMSFVAEPISIAAELNTMVQQDDGPNNYILSQKHILAVLKLMGCDGT